MHRHSLALRLQVLHPGLRDVEDAEAIYNINKRVLPGILEAFGRVEGGHWVAEPRYPTPEKKMPTNVCAFLIMSLALVFIIWSNETDSHSHVHRWSYDTHASTQLNGGPKPKFGHFAIDFSARMMSYRSKP